MQDKSKSEDLLQAFRNARGQTEEPPQEFRRTTFRSKDMFPDPNVVEVPHRRYPTSDKYKSFLDKYNDLERFIDGFNSQDLMYYFREKAREVDVKYTIANMRRDMGIFKKLLTSYSARDIALMIEFIFCSNQDYLDIQRTQPTVLSSSYVNTIYQDSVLWVDDKYVPGKLKDKRKPTIKKREWSNKNPTEERARIGEW